MQYESIALLIMVCKEMKILHCKNAKSCMMITTSTFKPIKIVDEKRQHGEAHSKPCFVDQNGVTRQQQEKEMQHHENK
jgi:hypothetical protein